MTEEVSRILRGYRKRSGDDLLLQPLLKYSPVGSLAPGPKDETWGSLLLLAVSAHLRETGHPNQLLAGKVLYLATDKDTNLTTRHKGGLKGKLQRLRRKYPSASKDLPAIKESVKRYFQKNHRKFRSLVRTPDTYFEKKFLVWEDSDVQKLEARMLRILPLLARAVGSNQRLS